MHVHAVRTCADDAAQARSAEFQLRIKPFLNLLFIACKSQQLSPQRRIKPFLSQPLPVYRFRLLHTYFSLLKNYFSFSATIAYPAGTSPEESTASRTML